MDAGQPSVTTNRRAADETPLVVDLDYTFLRVDVLWETLRRVATSPRMWWALWKNRPASRAALKDLLVPFAPDVTRLPVHDALRTWLAAERARGRTVVLATASHETLAARVASHHGVFDDVMATNATHNLKGARKRDALVARFGARGFVYVGDSRADRAVWAASAGAVVVRSAFGDVAQGLEVPVLREFDGPRVGRALLALLGPSRWWWALGALVPTVRASMNGATFLRAPEVVASDASVAGYAIGAFLVAIACSLIADLRHADADRAASRATPVGTGALSVPRAATLGALLLIAALSLAFAAGALTPLAVLAVLGFVAAWVPRGAPSLFAQPALFAAAGVLGSMLA